MRPALQRLLARPSSLDLLRALVRESTLERVNRPLSQRRVNLGSICGRCRFHTTLSAKAEVAAVRHSIVPDEDELVERSNEPSTTVRYIEMPQSPTLIRYHESTSIPTIPTIAIDKLDFESNVMEYSREPKLVNHPKLTRNPLLWLQLFEFRHRRYGDDGVAMFWKAMRRRNVDLICEGDLAARFWEPILDLGLKHQNLLRSICRYANRLYDATGQRWSELYVYIMKHLLLHDRTSEITSWHSRLIKRHRPDRDTFLTFIRQLVTRVDSDALKQIYRLNDCHGAYGLIVPPLVEKQDFNAAREWHFLLMKNCDRPLTYQLVKPLIQHYAIYQPQVAKTLTASLVSSGVSFGSKLEFGLNETMSLTLEVRDELFNESDGKPMVYNDQLGARWFATTWVSLDVAFNTVHALGVEEIGPLSLHSIALRDPTCEKVAGRISQLRELGISIGGSLFSKAVDSFSKSGNQKFLTGLLESDQHPDVLEDNKLQEQLIADFAERGQWASHDRSVAIQLLRSSHPEYDELNLILRKHAVLRDRNAILQTLERMRQKGIPLQIRSIHDLIDHLLRPRESGHLVSTAVDTSGSYTNDVDMAISVLRGIMMQNGFVPVVTWIELIKRLGMLRRLDDVDNLCIWLAEWYKHESPLRSQSLRLSSPLVPEKPLHVAPAQVPTYHHLHPLRILFSDALQDALVQWGFIFEMGLPRDPAVYIPNDEMLKKYTRGFRQLRQLQARGVSISLEKVRKAAYSRLSNLYGPGESNKIYNRRARSRNYFSMNEMVEAMDEAWGEPLFKDKAKLEEQILAGKSFKEDRTEIVPELPWHGIEKLEIS